MTGYQQDLILAELHVLRKYLHRRARDIDRERSGAMDPTLCEGESISAWEAHRACRALTGRLERLWRKP